MARDSVHRTEFDDDLELFIREHSDPAFANALRDAEERANCIRELLNARQRSGLTQTNVAAKMGTSQSTISEFENGDSDVYLSTLQRYARAIGSCVRVVVTYSNMHDDLTRTGLYGRSLIASIPIDTSCWGGVSRTARDASWGNELVSAAR